MKIPLDADLAEIHQAIREAHGAGRVEFLFDRKRALGHDLRESIGQLVLNPEYFPRAKDHEGVVVARGPVRYRVIVDPMMVGARDEHGRIRQGYWIAPVSAIQSLVLAMPAGDEIQPGRLVGIGADGLARQVPAADDDDEDRLFYAGISTIPPRRLGD